MLARHSGHVVNVSSLQGLMALPFRASYSASKHALHAFSDSLRAEVADRNVKVTVVSPGYVKTNLSLNAVTGSGRKHGQMDATTAGGYEPEDVARAIRRALMMDEKEIVLAPFSHRLAALLRRLTPNLYFFLMEARAAKDRKEKAQ